MGGCKKDSGFFATIKSVYDNILNVNAVAEDISNVNTVADNIVDVNTVAGNIVKVNTVADNIEDIVDINAELLRLDEAKLTTFDAPIFAEDSVRSRTADADLILRGNGEGKVNIVDDLSISGQIQMGDNIITLNAEEVGEPTENVGVVVQRGTSPNVSVLWFEGLDKWALTEDGVNYSSILTEADIDTTLQAYDLDLVIERNVFVSQATGDDNNDGSASAPYATISKAIDSCPVGGYRLVHVVGNYSWALSGEGFKAIFGKHISIVPSTATPDAILSFDLDTNDITIVKITGMSTVEVRMNFTAVNSFDTTRKQAFVVKNGTLVLDDNYTSADTQIECGIGENTQICLVRSGKINMDFVDFTISPTNTAICEYEAGIFSVPIGLFAHFKSGGTPLTSYAPITTRVDGKQTDANGSVYNIASSVDLT